MSAFLATGAQNFSAAARLHPTTETMLALADDLRGRLECVFHSLEIIAYALFVSSIILPAVFVPKKKR